MLYTLFVGVEKDALNHTIGAAEYRDMLTSAQHETAEQFGGYTMSLVTGGWKDPQGVLIREESIKFELSMEATKENDVKVRSWARWMRRRFHQASVLLTAINQGEEFITD